MDRDSKQCVDWDTETFMEAVKESSTLYRQKNNFYHDGQAGLFLYIENPANIDNIDIRKLMWAAKDSNILYNKVDSFIDIMTDGADRVDWDADTRYNFLRAHNFDFSTLVLKVMQSVFYTMDVYHPTVRVEYRKQWFARKLYHAFTKISHGPGKEIVENCLKAGNFFERLGTYGNLNSLRKKKRRLRKKK